MDPLASAEAPDEGHTSVLSPADAPGAGDANPLSPARGSDTDSAGAISPENVTPVKDNAEAPEDDDLHALRQAMQGMTLTDEMPRVPRPRRRKGASEEPAKVDTTRYKTKMCRNWESTGKCPYGPRCQFAHGAKDLHRFSGDRPRASAEPSHVPDEDAMSPYPVSSLSGLSMSSLQSSAVAYVPTQYIPVFGAPPVTVFNPVPVFSLGMPPLGLGSMRNPFLMYGV